MYNNQNNIANANIIISNSFKVLQNNYLASFIKDNIVKLLQSKNVKITSTSNEFIAKDKQNNILFSIKLTNNKIIIDGLDSITKYNYTITSLDSIIKLVYKTLTINEDTIVKKTNSKYYENNIPFYMIKQEFNSDLTLSSESSFSFQEQIYIDGSNAYGIRKSINEENAKCKIKEQYLKSSSYFEEPFTSAQNQNELSTFNVSDKDEFTSSTLKLQEKIMKL